MWIRSYYLLLYLYYEKSLFEMVQMTDIQINQSLNMMEWKLLGLKNGVYFMSCHTLISQKNNKLHKEMKGNVMCYSSEYFQHERYEYTASS